MIPKQRNAAVKRKQVLEFCTDGCQEFLKVRSSAVSENVLDSGPGRMSGIFKGEVKPQIMAISQSEEGLNGITSRFAGARSFVPAMKWQNCQRRHKMRFRNRAIASVTFMAAQVENFRLSANENLDFPDTKLWIFRIPNFGFSKRSSHDSSQR